MNTPNTIDNVYTLINDRINSELAPRMPNEAVAPERAQRAELPGIPGRGNIK